MSTNSLTPFNRRRFIRAAALAAAGTALGMPALAANPAAHPTTPARPRPLGFSSDLRDGLKPRRVTNAMWDYSWLTQHYPGGAFADFDRAADELVERGFNTVRIDAFPLVIGALQSENETITIPGDPLANWGMSDRDREHAVVRELVAFMRADETPGTFGHSFLVGQGLQRVSRSQPRCWPGTATASANAGSARSTSSAARMCSITFSTWTWTRSFPTSARSRTS